MVLEKVCFFLFWSLGVGDWGISTLLGKGWKAALLDKFSCPLYFALSLLLPATLTHPEGLHENKLWISSALVKFASCPRPESLSSLSPSTGRRLWKCNSRGCWEPVVAQASAWKRKAARAAANARPARQKAPNGLVLWLLLKTLSAGCGVIRRFPKCQQGIKSWGVAFWK